MDFRVLLRGMAVFQRNRGLGSEVWGSLNEEMGSPPLLGRMGKAGYRGRNNCRQSAVWSLGFPEVGDWVFPHRAECISDASDPLPPSWPP